MLSPKLITIIILNSILFIVFFSLLKKKNLLSYFSGGRWWLTWISVAVITLMDELTSIFYAPSEAFHFIGGNAIIFIAITSIFIRFVSTRMVEIAEILELHGIRGGGVYSFSYFVLGPTISFIAFASILVTYVLTASISTVSAVENGLAYYSFSSGTKYMFSFVLVWIVAGLNIMGIKENARFTFGIFIIAAIILLNFVALGAVELNANNFSKISSSFFNITTSLSTQNIFQSFSYIIIGISSCILAYSGIESVVQTAALVKSWKDIKKAYTFLALTVGIFTPVVSVIVLSSDINIFEHETDLMTYFAQTIGGPWFGILIGALASILLMMAMNTAYVASSELMERVAHRYGFDWLIKPNRRQSLYRVHIFNAIFYSLIIFITSGSQKSLAEMYAIGLVASFTINMASLIIYRYFKGTKDITAYHTSRTGTLIVLIIFIASFIYLAFTKPDGTLIWSIVTSLVLVGGLIIAKRRAPEIKHIKKTDSNLGIVLHLAEQAEEDVHVFFIRPDEVHLITDKQNYVYVNLFSPRAGIPDKVALNHFRITNHRNTLLEGMQEVLYTLEYELTSKKVTVHFGWPLSSWIDRISTGVMVFSFMKLPKEFPSLNFSIDYYGRNKINQVEGDK